MTATLDYLLVEDALPAAIITLNRPHQLNPLSTGLMKELTAELERQAARTEVRAIVLKGAGRAFSAGHDLKEMLDRNLDEEREIFAVCNKMMATVQSVPVPVIAAPHGIATAAGCQLVATCDLAIASDDCRFATSGVRYGLFCSTPGVAVARNVGRKHAMEMLLTGRFVEAASTVAPMTSSSCAAETNQASNCDGGSNTPDPRMRWKKRANASVSLSLASRKLAGARSRKKTVSRVPIRATLTPAFRRPSSRRSARVSIFA